MTGKTLVPPNPRRVWRRAQIAALGLCLVTTPALGGIEVRFVESAPKDRFEITNTGACPAGPFELAIDMTGSAGGLIFDTTGAGAGVEVFQPFEVVEGPVALGGTEIRDGDRVMLLRLDGLDPGQRAAISIDVDDTLRDSPLGQIRVAGGEIAGAEARIGQGPFAQRAAFGPDSVSRIETTSCQS